jgi:hypothetical protein
MFALCDFLNKNPMGFLSNVLVGCLFCFNALIVNFALLGDASAGSRDGYIVLVIDLDAGKSLASINLVNEYFSGHFPRVLYSCGNDGVVNFELVYLRKRPKAISEKIIESALMGDRGALARVRGIIGEYKDRDLSDGFDFLVAYRLKGEVLEVSAISSADGIPSVRRSLVVGPDFRALRVQKNFSGAICALVGSMPYVVAP